MLSIQRLLTAIAAVGMMMAVGAAQAQDTITVVEVENATSSSKDLLTINVSGTLAPPPLDPLPANTTDTFQSITPGTTVDAGVLTYSGCRFNWSKILDIPSGIWQFSIGGGSSDCSAQQVVADPFTGEYQVKFTIED